MGDTAHATKLPPAPAEWRLAGPGYGASIMNRLQRTLPAADRFQQRHRWLAFGVASWKKFGDDHAGNLAALIAYHAFVAIFPLLLVLVMVLSIVLSNDPCRHQGPPAGRVHRRRGP
jgi:hypothetical protein